MNTNLSLHAQMTAFLNDGMDRDEFTVEEARLIETVIVALKDKEIFQKQVQILSDTITENNMAWDNATKRVSDLMLSLNEVIAERNYFINRLADAEDRIQALEADANNKEFRTTPMK